MAQPGLPRKKSVHFVYKVCKIGTQLHLFAIIYFSFRI